jgi:hypothetical protein
MSIAWPPKTTTEVKDYGLDWTKELAGDVILSSTWESPVGLTVGETSFSNYPGKQTVIWLSGGTSGQKYTFTNTITTQGGRVETQSVSIKVI